MSTQLYYSLSNQNQRSPSTMSYPERASLFSGARSRRSPPQQGFGPGGINMYHQQQIQTALYQQQQIEFAQQQAQLEMHLQLEQMRLQNLALQEQIMIGQAHAQQAHAQAQAEQQQLHNTFYTTNQAPSSGRLTFTQGQGGLLAERALARRQQAEADALYAQCYPNVEEEDDVLRGLGGTASQYQAPSEAPHNLTPPAVVVSKPDEAFPLLVSADSSVSQSSATTKFAKEPGQHHGSAEAHLSSPNGFTVGQMQLSNSPPGSTEKLNGKNLPPSSIKKKFSEVVKSSLPSRPPSAPNTAAPPKLNPCSSVFVPGSTGGPDAETTPNSSPADTSPPQKVVSFSEQHNEGGFLPGVYRAPRSKSPPVAKAVNRVSSAPLTPVTQPVAGAMPTRQPRGPAAEAELTNQNFATRIRKRAIGAIKTLGPRPLSSPSPVSAGASNYQYYQQQQMLEALMIQQHQQQALAAAGYIDSDVGFHSNMIPSSGIAQLMATARAREERFGY